MPQYDDIQLLAVGIVGQPAIDWQNRPIFQQLVEFPERLSAQVPETPISAVVPLAGEVAGAGRGSAGRPPPSPWRDEVRLQSVVDVKAQLMPYAGRPAPTRPSVCQREFDF